MKKILCFFAFFILFSCKEYINKPKNLIDKEKMAEIIAEMTMNDQVSIVYPQKNMESGTRFILKKYNIKADDFTESYKYYIVNKKIEGIVKNAQEIILEKDPKAKKFVGEKLKKRDNIPPFAR